MKLTQELQTYLFFLFKKHLLSLEGIPLENNEGISEFIAKPDIADAICDILNIIKSDAIKEENNEVK